MMRVHIDGTRRALEAAKAAGVRRVVLASTSGTIAVSKEPVRARRARALPDRASSANWPYYLSKIYQEKLALDLGATLGLEVVIVNPSLLLGPGDERASSTGDVRRFLQARDPGRARRRRQLRRRARRGARRPWPRSSTAAPASAISSAGPTGPSPNTSDASSARRRCARPGSSCPNALALRAASLLEHAYKALDKEPPVERISVEMAQVYWWCDSGKAERELGFAARDPGETLDDTIRDLRTRMI